MAWWADVDGCGTSIDQWMAETVAPLLLVLGQLDLCMDHPPAPEGEAIETRADVERLGLDRCVASYILPENMLWWRLDPTGQRYARMPGPRVPRGRRRARGPLPALDRPTSRPSTTTTARSSRSRPHPFGGVPIVRVFDRRKPRCRNIGQSRYESVAERQREYYNRDSELILSDTTQAHPLLQGPEDFVQADGTIPIGPSWLLPKKKNTQGGAATYEGFDVVDFPKDGAESIRKNKADLRDDVDRDSALVRPTGRDGVAQSGLSKVIDHADGNNRLAKIAKVLARAERGRRRAGADSSSATARPAAEPSAIEVVYPTEFDLFTAGDVAGADGRASSRSSPAPGPCPITEGLMLGRLMRLCLPGLGDAAVRRCDAEIEAYLDAIGRGGPESDADVRSRRPVSPS